MLRNVVRHNGGNFTAFDETGRRVFIVESISFLFAVDVNPEMRTVKYRPIDYRDTKTLTQIEKYLRGGRYNEEIISSIVVRFGWMDKRLNKLSFIGLPEFMKLIRQNEATDTQHRKLQEICKQLSLSMKNVLK